MDQNSQLELDRILKLDPQDLNSDEIGFLRARRGYLTTEAKRIFNIHLEDMSVKQVLPEEPEEVAIDDAPMEEVKPQTKSKK